MLGRNAGTIEVPPGAPNVGAIVSQVPPPGSRVTRDTEVTLQGTGRVIR